MHPISGSNVKSHLWFVVSRQDSDLPNNHILIYFAITSEMSTITSCKKFLA